jgi:hypothetical protein
MQVNLSEGNAALIPSGPPHDPQRSHLFVFVTEPFEDEQGILSVALVPLSSKKDYMLGDPTCILQIGDHPFITKETWARYSKSRITPTESLIDDIKSQKIILMEPMNKNVLKKIKHGVCRSPYTPRRVKLFYQFASTLT